MSKVKTSSGQGRWRLMKIGVPLLLVAVCSLAITLHTVALSPTCFAACAAGILCTDEADDKEAEYLPYEPHHNPQGMTAPW